MMRGVFIIGCLLLYNKIGKQRAMVGGIERLTVNNRDKPFGHDITECKYVVNASLTLVGRVRAVTEAPTLRVILRIGVM